MTEAPRDSIPTTGRTFAPVRLRSLADSPEAFTSDHSRESTYDEAKWRDLAATGKWFVAVDDELVGVAVGVDGWSGDPKDRELVGMWVAPSHRRRGIAQALLDRVKAWAASEGATTLRLGVREGNEQALVAYHNMGMRTSEGKMPEIRQPTTAIIVIEVRPLTTIGSSSRCSRKPHRGIVC